MTTEGTTPAGSSGRLEELEKYQRGDGDAARSLVVAILPDSNFEQILRLLPENRREVIVMLKGLGMSLEEVARTTCSTVGAVKQKAHRAYERLRSLLSKRVAGAEL